MLNITTLHNMGDEEVTRRQTFRDAPSNVLLRSESRVAYANTSPSQNS